MGQAGGTWVWGPQGVCLACQADNLFTAQVYDLLLKLYPKHESASSSVAFLWSLSEFEIFVLKAFVP